MGKLFLFCLAGVLVLGCTVSCKSRTAYQDERAVRAVVEHYRIKGRKDEAKSLTLQDCISAGMTNTLSARFLDAAEKKVDPQAAVEILEMLPSFRFRDDLPARSNAPGLTIRRPNFYNVDLMIGLLDFGLGYWYTKETLYRAAFREQILRKTVNKIQFETAQAYYRTAALQTACSELEKIQSLRNESKKWMKGGDPRFAAGLHSKLGKMEQSIHKTRVSYENACIQLRSLMGLRPDSKDIILDEAAKKEPVELKLPALEIMEQIALARRPELYMGDIRKVIPLPACYNFMRQLLPGISGKEACSAANCRQLGARALYDLLQTPDRYAGKGAGNKERIAAIHSYAGALAVMAQVRIAYNEYKAAFSLYKEARNALADCELLCKKGRKGTPEYADMFLDTLRAKLKKECSAMRCRIAESRILYTLGVSKLDFRLQDTVMEELEDAEKAAREDLEKARQHYSDEQVRLLVSEVKRLQKEEAERKERELADRRDAINKEIDKKYGSERNPALWEKMGK